MRISTLATAGLFALAILLGATSQSARAQGATYKIVAFTGQSAPGGGTFDLFQPPRIGADGTIGFVEQTSGEGYQAAIYAGTPGSLRLVAETDDSGRSPNSFASFFDLSVSKDGFVAFTAMSTSEELAVWSDAPGGGLDDPDAGKGTDINPIELGSIAFRSGRVALKAVVSDGESQTQVLLEGKPSSLVDIIKQGQLLDGLPLVQLFDVYDYQASVGRSMDRNESGAVAFKAAVAVPGPSATPIPRQAIYAGQPSDPKLVAMEGDDVPGLSGSSYRYLFTEPSIAANGLVAFASTIFPGEVGPDSGIFSGTPGAIAPVVLSKSTVPTTNNVKFTNLDNAVVNSTGDVIFHARIQYPDFGIRSGYWIQRRTGPAVLLAVDGMSLPGPDGQPREVTSVDAAPTGTFNDLHEFVFKAEFENGDQGIYVADTRPGAPEVVVRSPRKPRDFVTPDGVVEVSGFALDDTGIEKVEYTVAREVSSSDKRKGKKKKKPKKWVVTRVKKAKGDNAWSFKVPLALGLNLISIVATDKLGNQSEPYKVRMLRYDPDEE